MAKLANAAGLKPVILPVRSRIRTPDFFFAQVAQSVDAPVSNTGCWEFESPLEHHHSAFYFAPVMELAYMSVLETESCGFKSRLGHHFFPASLAQ
jgi:hypothetical protein